MKHISDLHLAPLKGFTDVAFRSLISKTGRIVCYSEMIHSSAIISKKVPEFIINRGYCKDFGIQLFGNSEKELIKSAKILEKKYECDFINFNFGCPDKNILKSKSGGYWLKDIERLINFSKMCKKELAIPFSFKTRLGYEKSIASEFVKLNVDELIVHCRTVKQGFSGKAKYEDIYKLKEITNFPIIGNGDIFHAQDYYSKKRNLDGIMIGRGALRNPSIFSEIQSNKKISKIKLFYNYLELAEEFKIEFKRIKQLSYIFTKETKNAKKLRTEMNKSKSIEEIKKIILKIEEQTNTNQ
ncbi:MAG: tRNA-dihydrouridine synthase family protein [Candidatus Woesearchaeota archaeon]